MRLKTLVAVNPPTHKGYRLVGKSFYGKTALALKVRSKRNDIFGGEGILGIKCGEGLEAHLSEIESSSGAEWEFRRLFGIYNATLSQSQREYFRKWSEDYGYSVGIVSLAYDIAVLNTRSGRGDLRYIDAILTEWHNAGCKTVNECREYIEAERAKKAAKTPIRTGKKATKSTPETPRYGNFDINEAFNDAVARSFSEDNGDEGGDQ